MAHRQARRLESGDTADLTKDTAKGCGRPVLSPFFRLEGGLRLAATRLMPRHVSDGKSILASIKDALDYGRNPNKTRDGDLVSSYGCDPRTAAMEFVLAKQEYAGITGRSRRREDDLLLYQIRQSFRPGEISPEEANRISYELAMRFMKGKHAFLICTLEDKDHFHSHIYFNSTSLECDRKFRNFCGSARAVRRISDILCGENGLSIVENPGVRGKRYAACSGDNRPAPHRGRSSRPSTPCWKAGPPASMNSSKAWGWLGIRRTGAAAVSRSHPRSRRSRSAHRCAEQHQGGKLPRLRAMGQGVQPQAGDADAHSVAGEQPDGVRSA